MIRLARLATVLAIGLLGPGGATPGAAPVPPRLAALLARSRVAVAGTVGRVDTYDDGRVTVAHVVPERTFKGEPGAGDVLVVEELDRPSSVTLLRPGGHVVVFLERAGHTSALSRVLPPGPTYFRMIETPQGALISQDPGAGREAAALVGRMAEASTDTTSEAAVRAEQARALAFDEIAARNPALVADGAASLPGIAGLASTLRDEERAGLVRALQRTDLPAWIRIAVIDGVAGARLVALAPTLRQLDRPSPDVLAASWRALARLGQPPSADDLARYGTDPDPAVRATVPTALLAAGGDDALPQVERMALDDKDLSVRRAAVDALGATKSDSTIPSLERIYRAGPIELQRACATAYLGIGDRPAAESLARLAFDAPRDGQRLATTALLALVSKDDPLVARIRTTHPDPELRDVLEHGPYLGHHHDQ